MPWDCLPRAPLWDLADDNSNDVLFGNEKNGHMRLVRTMYECVCARILSSTFVCVCLTYFKRNLNRRVWGKNKNLTAWRVRSVRVNVSTSLRAKSCYFDALFYYERFFSTSFLCFHSSPTIVHPPWHQPTRILCLLSQEHLHLVFFSHFCIIPTYQLTRIRLLQPPVLLTLIRVHMRACVWEHFYIHVRMYFIGSVQNPNNVVVAVHFYEVSLIHCSTIQNS